MPELAVVLGIAAAFCVVWGLGRAMEPLRVQLIVFNGFYFLTSVIGAMLVVHPDFQLVWSITAGGAAVDWLRPGDAPRYWVLLLAPFVLVNVVALLAYRGLRPLAVGVTRNLGIQVSPLAVAMVGAAMIGYCLFNLARHGYLGVNLLGSSNEGFFRDNIQLRTVMAQELGALHFGIVYMALPAVCVTALASAARARSTMWWTLFGLLTAAAFFMYTTTLTKSHLLVFIIGITVAALNVGLIRVRGMALVASLSIVLLAVQEALLSGSGAVEFMASISNLVMRLSSAIPFYVEIFPQQEPFVGIDYGLGWFGIGPSSAPNLLVFNYMFPDITYVQGAAPAAAHISAYAQAGMWLSLVTLVLVGVVVAFFGALGTVARSALARSAFVGGAVMCYYATQTDFVGAFNHSYGYKWWLFGLMAVAGTELVLRWMLSGRGKAQLPGWRDLLKGVRL